MGNWSLKVEGINLSPKVGKPKPKNGVKLRPILIPDLGEEAISASCVVAVAPP